MGQSLILVAVIAVFGFCIWLGYALSSAGRAGVSLLLMLIPTLFAAGFFIAAAGAQGWDALGYFVIAVIFCLPPAVGLAIGTLAGWMKYRRLEQRNANT